ncbi:DUF2147 domain-containing protein [Sphingomonas sp. MMSM20]|uniref:DUF2147 domain-containing protein n=1 Tax=Sphingomonas lycopersici TaxID=2951807 RepID=UPI0022384FB0|nr:DUF2147 domain-containing protein [Sphingomonas lycopersici]MCW6530513.1 DUF2147 domain-containing protein [Sphingomonas lycopersici]
MTRPTLPALIAPLLLTLPGVAHAADPIAGRYLTEDGSGIVAIGACGKAMCGKLATIVRPTPNGSTTDVKNPDPALRTRPLLGMQILNGLTDKGGDWRGEIYDPRRGKTFKSVVSRNADGTLNVKGCLAFICQTQLWRPAR